MPRIAIVGGGLSGLYAALLLERHHLDYVLLEARNRFGGRIESIPSGAHGFEDTVGLRPSINRFDVGAAWYWPAIQPHFADVLKELGLEGFEQHEEGDMLIERSPNHPAARVGGHIATPRTMRLIGGMTSMVEAIGRHLSPARLRTQARVHSIVNSEDHSKIIATNSSGANESFEVETVLLAVPPRIAAKTIEFQPQIPPSWLREWNDIGTWMAPHAKYVATFEEAFWRKKGLSGEARSIAGPLAEIHDSSAVRGDAALFGFLSVPAEGRAEKAEGELKADCRAQLVRLFGPEADKPKDEFLKDWAREPFTATQMDQHPGLHQTQAPPALADNGPWRNRLIGIASEWSPQFPGYVAGAIDAATRGVMTLGEF